MATILVTWTAGGGANVVNQTVKRSIAGANSYSTLATVGAAVTSYTDTTAADNTLYQYQIVTNCSSGGPTINLGANPETIYIDCGSSDISASVQYNALNTPYPQITWTIFNRLSTDTKTYSWVWKKAGVAQTYVYTVDTQNAVSGIFNEDLNSNALLWNTVYTLEVVFKSTNNAHSRTCTFNVTTPAQPVCAAATGLSGSNEYTVDFGYNTSAAPSGGGGTSGG